MISLKVKNMMNPIFRRKNPDWWKATMVFSERALLLKGLIWDYKETAPAYVLSRSWTQEFLLCQKEHKTAKAPCGERFCNRKFILLLKTVSGITCSLHFFYKWISFKFSLHNWLAHRRNFVQSARIRSSAHACSSCNALRPSTINLAAFPKTRPFLWSILRDHGQFSRLNPSPLVAFSGFSVYPRYVTFALVVVDFSHHLKHITRWGKEYAVRICY